VGSRLRTYSDLPDLGRKSEQYGCGKKKKVWKKRSSHFLRWGRFENRRRVLARKKGNGLLRTYRGGKKGRPGLL